jgi:pyruvate ferredoxin oxidoreductase delta subunit
MDKFCANPLAKPMKGAGGITGSWRTSRPVLDPEKCNGCLICWLFCPENAIVRENRAIDYEYCKGCGVCAVECPRKAIAMIKEEER